MNSKKGKGKPRPNKPATPNPPQKEDQIEAEKKENVLEEIIESAQKSEERVPEIISEVVNPPVVDSKDDDKDSPKKPKRNRGKKKKNEKDDGDTPEGQQSEQLEDVPFEIIEIESKEISAEENVTPSARKKKNKNKKNVETDSKTIERVEKDIPLEENIPPADDKTGKEEYKTHEGEHETKAAKKKNKKKKRNDSERSDAKAEEISCTSAFQQLLKDDKSDAKTTESEQAGANLMSPDLVKKEEMNISTFIQEMEKMDDVKEEPQEIIKGPTNEGGGKSKKKNKKDKKEPPPEIEPDFSLVTAIKPISKESAAVITEELSSKDREQAPILSPVDVQKTDEDTRPKAKIAKPVERKRKGKGDKQTDEFSETESHEHEIEEKEVITPKVIHDIPQTVVTPKEGEVASETSKDESKIAEAHTTEKKEEHNLPKPNEKKRKGKGNKHTEEPQEKSEHEQTKHVEAPTQLEEKPASEPIVKEEPIVLEAQGVEDNRQTITKPADKKKKGKANKQGQDTTEIVEIKDIAFTKDKQISALTSEVAPKVEHTVTPETKTEQEIIILPEIAEEVKDEEDKNETVKPAERKHKSKKDKKNQHLMQEAAEDKDSKMKEKTPEPHKTTSFPLEKSSISLISPEELIKSEQKIETAETKQESKKEAKSKDKISGKIKDQKQSAVENIESKTSPVSLAMLDTPKPTEIIKDVPFMPEPLENIQTKQEVISDIETNIATSGTEELKDSSLISAPETSTDKKRKKSPKPKHDQKHKVQEPKPVISPDIVDPERKEAKQEEVKMVPIPLPPPPPPLPELKFEHQEVKPADIQEASAPVLLQTDDNIHFETKTKKKKKKSPKLPLDEPATSRVQDSGSVQSEKVDKSELLFDLPSDIEIRSLKADDSEGSTCGFTPDVIQYPRATSQDLIDDNNNNMMIQEISAAEEAKLQIPINVPDTPFIQGSGCTPLETPDNILLGIRISQPGTTAKSEPEKTDIKSKMMEVNQDMEELRLSIERSLAELTAIEKTEGEIEKQFEDKKHVLKEPKSPETKISMPSELIAKAQTEKLEVIEKKEGVADTSAVVDKPAESAIPPKTSMFFDKELKDTGVPILDVDVGKSKEPAADVTTPPVPPMRKDKSASKERENKDTKSKTEEIKPSEAISTTETPKPVESTTPVPPVPARKDQKNKGKNKKKGKQEEAQAAAPPQTSTSASESKDPPKDYKKEEKTEKKPAASQEKGKQQAGMTDDGDKTPINQDESNNAASVFDPIENFDDAMTSSADDINKTFEMIADEASRSIEGSHVNPEIKIIAPTDDAKKDKKKRDEKINPVSQPKNFLGHPDIPVRLNKTDYKKEKDKTPNDVLAKVKIKDSVEIEANKQSKDTQTDNIRKFMKDKSIDETFSSFTNENDEFIFKYSFRKVFLQSNCHVCKKDLKQSRVPCSYCNLLFYCNNKHKDEDWPQHQGFCFAISTIVHLKNQKHIYADAINVTGQDYRLLRMQAIVSCERVLKRRLAPWEQEALLYPRMCADASCRDWRQSKLLDCEGCGQISYCASNPNHLPKSHQRWCKSYALYQKLVCYQQTKGRLEPKLPTKVMEGNYEIPEKINEVLAGMYEEKIDMNDIQYATLTQIATSPLTVAFYHQLFMNTIQVNGACKKTTCTVHIIGSELQFEADALNKWEVFFLHLRPQLQELRIVMIGADLNPSNLPLELLGKLKMCENCRLKKRRVVFNFHDKTTYHDYCASDDFVAPDIVCAFNPGIHRSTIYNGKDHWPRTVSCIAKLKAPFLITSSSLTELQRDVVRVRELSPLGVVSSPRASACAGARPDRNFVSDDAAPLLCRNYCAALLAAQR